MQSPEDREQRRVHIERSQVGGIGDGWHVEGGIHIYPEGEKPEGRCDYYRHISLPPHYVPRPAVLDAARAALLESVDGMALTSAIQQAPEALHGMGGVGKTVVARALCEDKDVREAFSDGILWTTLGRNVTDSELRIKLREWVDALGGMVGETAPTLDRLKAILAQLLEDRTCLLVVDDIWRRTHAEVFQVGGPHCRLLITTRDAEIARGLGARLHPVNVMACEQAVTLLEQWADSKLDDVDDDVEAEIVERVSRLPLAVKLAGEQLRRHGPEEWLENFDATQLCSNRLEGPRDDLFSTLSFSLKDLDEDEGEENGKKAQKRRCYTALAIFPEDEPIPLAALSKLWDGIAGLDEYEARDLMYDLAARALVQLHESAAELAVTLHDLLRDCIAAELGEPGMRDAHRLLLDAYRKAMKGEGRHTVPPDGYFYDHLTYHLDALANHDEEASDELQALFATDAWLHARVPVDEYRYDGYLADLALAWQRAQTRTLTQISNGQPPRAVAESVRAALIHTSVNALATAYEPELVARAVETDLWSPARGLSVLRRVADAERQAEMAAGLLANDRLSEGQRKVARDIGVAAARALADEARWVWKRAEVLAAMAPYLEDDLLAETLAAVRMIGDEWAAKREILVTLAPHLKGELVIEGLDTVRALEDEVGRAQVLAALAPQLSEELLARGLDVALAIACEYGRAYALAALAPQLEDAQLTRVLDATRAIEDERWRAEILVALAPQLDDDLLVEALDTIRAIEDEEWRVGALVALSRCLEEEACQEVLAESQRAARTIEDEELRVRVLVTLAPHLEEKVRKQVLAESLAAACAVEKKAWILATLVPLLEEEARHQVLVEGVATAREIEDEEERVWVLGKLAPHLEGHLLREGLTLACSVEDQARRAEALTKLAPGLKDDLLEQGLTEAHAIRNERQGPTTASVKPRDRALRALRQQLEGDLLTKELTIGYKVKDVEHLAEALVALAPLLTDEAREQVLVEGIAAAYTIEDVQKREEVLTALAGHLRGDLLIENFAAIRAIEEDWKRVEAFAALTPQLDDDQLVAELEAAREMGSPASRAKVLSALAVHLEGPARRSLMAEALAAIRSVDLWYRGNHLAALVPNLEDDQLSEALAIACEIGIEERRGCALTALVRHSEGEVQQQAIAEALATARVLESDRWRARDLAALAPYLTDGERQQALSEGIAAARQVESERHRADALTMLVPHLRGAIRQQVVSEAMDAARKVDSKKSQIQALATLASCLDDEARQQVLSESLGAISGIGREKSRAEAVVTVAPYIASDTTGSMLVRGLAMAGELKNEEYRAKALAAVAVQMMQVPDTDTNLLQEAREELVECLWSYRVHERKDLFELLTDNDAAFLRAFDLPSKAYAQIAQSIIDICTKWEWL